MIEMRDYIEYKEKRFLKHIHRKSQSHEEAMVVVVTEAVEEVMLDEEEVLSLVTTVASKGI